jgi:hypothetical protein
MEILKAQNECRDGLFLVCVRFEVFMAVKMGTVMFVEDRGNMFSPPPTLVLIYQTTCCHNPVDHNMSFPGSLSLCRKESKLLRKVPRRYACSLVSPALHFFSPGLERPGMNILE